MTARGMAGTLAALRTAARRALVLGAHGAAASSRRRPACTPLPGWPPLPTKTVRCANLTPDQRPRDLPSAPIAAGRVTVRPEQRQPDRASAAPAGRMRGQARGLPGWRATHLRGHGRRLDSVFEYCHEPATDSGFGRDSRCNAVLVIPGGPEPS
jgi:hypothetical protein